jgi:putative ABC transport system substrate-binding protein
MVRRRDFIVGLGGAAAWPAAAWAQQRAMPVVGILDIASPSVRTLPLMAFRRGLNETGYVEGRDVAIEYRGFENQWDRLPGLAADLVRRQVAVIFGIGPPVVRALKAQTATIPIVFFVGEDPVKEGLVASFNRPGGNVTGTTNFQNQLFGEQMGLLAQAVPKATVLAFLVNPDNPNAEPDTKDAQAAANALGRELRVLTARNDDELEMAFAAMAEQRVGGLLVGAAFLERRQQLGTLAARHALPTMYQDRLWPEAGGLMSYGASVADAWHLCGVYIGRILKGEKPADLPVQQATKFEFIINLQAAKVMGIEIPANLLAVADEVIE